MEKQTVVQPMFEGLEVSEAPARKLNRHVVIALNHMNQRRETLLKKRAELTREIEELDAAILALG